MDGTINPQTDYISNLFVKEPKWPAIIAGQQRAAEVRSLLSETLEERLGSYATEDVNLIVFGSLARGEWTSGSDVDWTLLIDGQSNPDHQHLSTVVRDTISKTCYNTKPLQEPGTEGIFGNLASSHDMVHHIGGQADTNRNTSQRVLLLLESMPIRPSAQSAGVGAYERVTKNVLSRYLQDDTNFYSKSDDKSRIPRFFLNDVVRYWRTMCVDFAYKEWEQDGKKWALRNIKLRMSRKLLFVSALLTIFSCYENHQLLKHSEAPAEYLLMMQDHLMPFVQSTPMNIVIWTLLKMQKEDTARELLDTYDTFLNHLLFESSR